jgi:hypothetical protein
MSDSDTVSGTYDSGGNYLKADDLGGEDWELVITAWEKREMDQTDFETGEKYKKWKAILSFAGEEKKLVLNKTNATTIKQSYGDRYDDWIGKTIILFEGSWQDKPAIRVRVPKVVRKAASKSDPQRPLYDERNPPPADEIPY